MMSRTRECTFAIRVSDHVPILRPLAVLRIVENSSRSSLAQFELGADLLDLRGLLFKLAYQRLYFLLLLRNGSLELVPQLFHFPMLFEKLIQRHRVDLLVANGFGQSCWFATCQVRMHFGHFLRDQFKGDRLRSIVLLVVAKADRLKWIDGFAGCVHWLNVMFVSAGRDVRAAKSSVAGYGNQVGVGPNNGLHVGVDVADNSSGC